MDNQVKHSLPWPHTLYRAEASPFRLDLRSIGLFRVLLALVILLDQVVRISDWRAFHSTSGLVSLSDSHTWESPWLWSIYWLSDAPILPYILEVLRLLATIALLFGIRSRLSAFVLFVLLASVAARTPLILQGGDKVLIVMTFFAVFLPLGQWASLEHLWFETRPKLSHRSAASVAYVVQVLLVFFMAGVLKTGEQWWSTGTAAADFHGAPSRSLRDGILTIVAQLGLADPTDDALRVRSRMSGSRAGACTQLLVPTHRPVCPSSPGSGNLAKSGSRPFSSDFSDLIDTSISRSVDR